MYYFYILIVLLVFPLLGRSSEIFNSTILYYVLLLPSIPFVKSQGIIPLVHLWFIGSLIIFYLITPIFAKCKEDKKSFYALIIASIWFVVKLLLKINGGGLFYRLVGCTCFDIFFLGVWGGLIIKRGIPLSVSSSILLNIFAWMLFLSSGIYGHYVPAPIRTEFVAILSLVIIVTQQKQKSDLLLENKVARFLGNISYEIYVGHIIVIILLSAFYTRLKINAPDWCIYLLTSLVVIICALLIKKVLSHMFPSKKIVAKK